MNKLENKNKDEYYIIYHNDGRFSDDIGGGYFVSYKNRNADNYSESFLQAKQYKSIGNVVKRFNLHKDNPQYSLELKETTDKQIHNILSKKNKLHNILDKKEKVKLNWEDIRIFSQGRIEKITMNGNKKPKLESANKEVYNYISEIVDKFEKRKLALQNRIKIISPDLEIVDDPTDSFWD